MLANDGFMSHTSIQQIFVVTRPLLRRALNEDSCFKLPFANLT
jgi:hypothetical protein